MGATAFCVSAALRERSLCAIAVRLCLVAAMASAGVSAQSGATYKTPRTPWGEPDVQGTYSNRTITPFERQSSVNGREFFTREEAAALEKRAQEQNGDEGRSKGTRGDVERAYNDFWWDRGTKVTSLRTSLVIDPPDGRVANTLLRGGLTRDSLPIGTEIVVDGYRAKNGTNRANGRDVMFPDGRKLFMGSSGVGAPPQP